MKNKGLSWVVPFMMLILMITTQGSSSWQTGSIKIGDTVEVVTNGNNLNLRSAPGVNQAVVAKLPPGTRMKVIDGPQQADNYVWWKLNGSEGTGWAAGNFLRVVEQSMDQGASSSPDQGTSSLLECEEIDERFAGVRLCTRDQDKTHVVVIDLNDPHVRFETVMAGDATRTNTMSDSIKETIPQMAARISDEAAVINSDYSGSGHGPEGLTIKTESVSMGLRWMTTTIVQYGEAILLSASLHWMAVHRPSMLILFD
jgi:uncharacterized protein YgiM (DUF1202 family)